MIWLPLETAWGQDAFDVLRQRFEAIELRVSTLENSQPVPGDVVVSPGDKLSVKVGSAKPGQTVLVLPGDYGPILVEHWVPNITIKAKPGARIVTTKEDYFGLQFAGPKAQGITVEGLTIDAKLSNPTAGGVKATAGIKVTVHQGVPARGITLRNLTVLNSPSVGLLVDTDAAVTMEDSTIVDTEDYAVYCASSGCVFRNLTLKAKRWGAHFYREDGMGMRDNLLEGSDLWDSEGIIAYRGRSKILGNKVKRIVVGGTAKGWVVSKNTVERIQTSAGSETVLSTTSGVADDNNYALAP